MSMVKDSDKNKKGFSGLSDLAFDVKDIDDPIKSDQKTNPSTSKQHPQPQQEALPFEAERKTTNIPLPIDLMISSKNDRGSGGRGKWILGIIGVILVIWLINKGDQSGKIPSYDPVSPSPNHSHSQSSPVPQTSNVNQNTGLQYIKPSVGNNNVLSVPEIRWCIREKIRIEAMRDVIDTNDGIDEFNRIVNDYNSRCGSYRYRQGSQAQAERDVEPYRSQIVAKAIREARQLGRSYRPSYPSASSGTLTDGIPKKPSARYIKEVQQLLTDLGYDPGPVDGDYGRQTAAAVKAFQRDFGFAQDGWIDEDLLNMLRMIKSAVIR